MAKTEKINFGINEDPEGFPQRLRAIRAYRKLTQEQVVEKLGVATSVYSAWETGNHLPRGANYSLLAQALDVPIEALIKKAPAGVSNEEWIRQFTNKKMLSYLSSSELDVNTDLPALIKNSEKKDFSLMERFQEAYEENRVFLFKVEGHSMSRSTGKSLNEGMTAVIVNEANLKILEHKVVLIAVGGQKAELRELSFDQGNLILTPWNQTYSVERVVLTKDNPAKIFGYVALAFNEF